jgi:hypothetical protein
MRKAKRPEEVLENPANAPKIFNKQPLEFWKKSASRYAEFLVLNNKDSRLTDEQIFKLVQKDFPGGRGITKVRDINWVRHMLKGDYPSTPVPKCAQGLEVPDQIGGPPLRKPRKGGY